MTPLDLLTFWKRLLRPHIDHTVPFNEQVCYFPRLKVLSHLKQFLFLCSLFLCVIVVLLINVVLLMLLVFVVTVVVFDVIVAG